MQTMKMERTATMMDMGMNMMNTMPKMNMMVPCANMIMEKCERGMMVKFMANDENSKMMINNLCNMLNGGMVSMNMMMNGMTMMNCNMVMGMCNCEINEEGINMMWTSEDNMVCNMISECCNSIMSMMECNCTAVMCMNNVPVCCC